MHRLPNTKTVLRALPLILYALFFAWYTNLSGPVSRTEADDFLNKMRLAEADATDVQRWQDFLYSDDGGQFFMVNVSDERKTPLRVAAVTATETTQETMQRYMKFMLPRLLQRACMPVFAGNSVGKAMDLTGLDEELRNWDRVAIMRYRSRGDLLEIAKELVSDGSHDYKMAALNKTIAIPVNISIYMFEPRIVLALLAIIGWLLLRNSRRLQS